MARFAAFLRAINLGSRNKVSSGRLRSIFEEMGFEEVATFRTSGNVIFDGPSASAPKLGARIGKELEAAVGFEVITFVRTAREIRAIADHEPFAKKAVDASKGKLQVMLLEAKPAAAVRKEILALATDEDRLAFGARELSWLPSGGTQKSALNLRTIAKLLEPMTQRTKGTMDEIARKYFAE